MPKSQFMDPDVIRKSGYIELTNEEKVDVEEYILFAERKNELQDRIDSSVYMQLDFNNVYHAKKQYYLYADVTEGYDIACAIKNYIQSGAFADALNANMKNKDMVADNDLVAATLYDGSSILYIDILAGSEEEAKEYAKIYDEMFAAYSEVLKEKIPGYGWQLIHEDISCEYTWNVYDGQRAYIQKYSELDNDLERLEGNLSDDQMLYLSSIYETEEEGEGKEETTTAPKWNILYAVVGAALGVILVAGLVVLDIMFSGRIQTKQEIQKRLEVAAFGKVNFKSDEVDMAISRMKALLANENIKDFMFVSSMTMDDKNAEALIQKLNANDVDCKTIDNLLNDRAAIEKLSQDKAVILVESIGKTKVNDVYQEATICKDMNVRIVGYLMV